jgi:ABC-2 type transport system ATP-binding protein
VTTTISLRGISQQFAATYALTTIDLDLAPGVTGLLGPNGAGKTTLLRLAGHRAGAEARPPQHAGQDQAVPAQRTGIRRRLGYLPQELGFPAGSAPSPSWTTSPC